VELNYLRVILIRGGFIAAKNSRACLEIVFFDKSESWTPGRYAAVTILGYVIGTKPRIKLWAIRYWIGQNCMDVAATRGWTGLGLQEIVGLILYPD